MRLDTFFLELSLKMCVLMCFKWMDRQVDLKSNRYAHIADVEYNLWSAGLIFPCKPGCIFSCTSGYIITCRPGRTRIYTRLSVNIRMHHYIQTRTRLLVCTGFVFLSLSPFQKIELLKETCDTAFAAI